MNSSSSVTIGIIASLIASLMFAVLSRLLAVLNYRSRARRFTGKYRMLDQYNEIPRGGTVVLEYHLWEQLWAPAPVLNVFAEHGTGAKDWTGAVEILGISNVASGFYAHGDGAGGALWLTLASDNQQITEHGIPSDPQYQDFVRRLQRIAR